MKRVLSLILVVLMAVSLFSASILTVDAATTLTEDEFAAKISTLKTRYPDGKYWNQYNGTEKLTGISISVAKAGTVICKSGYGGVSCTSRKYCHPSCSCSCGQFPVTGSGQCFGFANLMAYHIFGSYVATGYSKSSMNTSKGWTYLTSVSTFYAGDFVVIDNKAHTIFVYKVTDSTVYYVDCNASGPCKIEWDNSISISSLKNRTTLVGRMSGNTLKGTGSTNNVLTINYNANGGTIPPHHSYEVTTPDTVLRLRSKPSLDGTNLTQLPDGTIFDATETATADGYTWAKTTYNGYTGWCAVSDGLATRLGYYLQSVTIYRYSDSKIRTQKWKYGEGGTNGLINDTTFEIQKEGYSFVGWSLSKDGSTTVFDQDNTDLKAEDICPDLKNGSQTVTLYAIWKANTYTVSYDANGGSGAPGSQTKTHGQTLTLSSTVPTRTGYTFLGWSAASNAATATYTAGDTYTANNAAVLYAVWDEIELGTVDKWNVTLEDDLSVNFYVWVSDSKADTAEIKVTVADDTYSYAVKDLEQGENGCYRISVNIAAAQMKDAIVIMGMNQGEIGSVSSYTVRQYCDTILADASQSKYHAIVKEMLHYGAMAQMYFGYDAENLANTGITGAAATAVPETAEEMAVADQISGVDFYGASLVYRDRIAVRYYFTGDVTGLTFTANGKTYTPVAKDGMHYVEIADILPQNLDQPIALSVTDAEDNVLSVGYNPINYIVRINQKGSAELQNLVKALYNYHLAAKALEI